MATVTKTQMETLSPCWLCLFKALILLIIANGMPVLARIILGQRFAWPVDFGHVFIDNRPLFGHSKTWRGLLVAILSTSLLAPVFGLPPLTGGAFGILAMTGDLAASFIKRRLAYVESSRFRALDVLPESLLPILILREALELTIIGSIFTVSLFFIFEALISPILFRLHIRKRPY